MSTKRLSRTVIEGGRTGWSKYNRRNSHNEERAGARDFCKKALVDPEYSEEFDIEPKTKACKFFNDKLSPMNHWLDSQVGRPWDEVRSEIFQTFDTRTNAGRHITFDHLLSTIVETDSGYDERGIIINPDIELEKKRKYRWSYFSQYYVDKNGILCKTTKESKAAIQKRYQTFSQPLLEEVEKWLSNRMIGEKGGRLYWYMSTQRIWKATWIHPETPFNVYSNFNLKYYLLEKGPHMIYFKSDIYPYYESFGMTSGSFWKEIENPFSFRQRGELNKEDAKYFRELPERLRNDILSFTKDR